MTNVSFSAQYVGDGQGRTDQAAGIQPEELKTILATPQETILATPQEK